MENIPPTRFASVVFLKNGLGTGRFHHKTAGRFLCTRALTRRRRRRVFASSPPSYRRASFLDTHLHAYTMASIAKFSVAPKVAAARHGRFAGSRVSKVRAPTRDSGIARRGHVSG